MSEPTAITKPADRTSPVATPPTREPSGTRDTENLEGALTRAVALALNGEWSSAEVIVHDRLKAIPVEALPHAYIGCVDIIARLLEDARIDDQALPRFHGRAPAAPEPARPLLGTRPDPAFDYAHAVLTALRARLGARPAPARRAG